MVIGTGNNSAISVSDIIYEDYCNQEESWWE
jgi:hypothetical protein